MALLCFNGVRNARKDTTEKSRCQYRIGIYLLHVIPVPKMV